MMIDPTPAEIIAIKSSARAKFGRDLALRVPLTSPIEAVVVVAPFDLASYAAHVDARQANAQTAQLGIVVDRLLWCSPADAASPTIDSIVPTKDDPDPFRRVALDRYDALQEMWPAVASLVDRKLLEIAGRARAGELARAVPLSVGTAPHGLSPADAAKLLEGRPVRGAGSLWSVTHGNGLALVMSSPQPDAWLAARAAWGESVRDSKGIIDSMLVLARQLIEWSPEPFEALIDRKPGYAEALLNPMLDMGGAGAQASADFL
jgi:hypothetical protein